MPRVIFVTKRRMARKNTTDKKCRFFDQVMTLVKKRKRFPWQNLSWRGIPWQNLSWRGLPRITDQLFYGLCCLHHYRRLRRLAAFSPDGDKQKIHELMIRLTSLTRHRVSSKYI
jgi:hypothetical protein